MANGGIGNKCIILVAILIVIILLCENGKLKMENFEECPDLSPQEFEQLLKSKDIVLAKFYAPWCPHCTKLTGTMNELHSKYADDPKVGVAKVNADKHRDAADKYQVRGFPTIKVFKGGKEAADHQGSRDVKGFSASIEKQR